MTTTVFDFVFTNDHIERFNTDEPDTIKSIISQAIEAGDTWIKISTDYKEVRINMANLRSIVITEIG